MQKLRLDGFIARRQLSAHHLRGVNDDYVGRAWVGIDVEKRAKLYVHLGFFPCLSNRGLLNTFAAIYIAAGKDPLPDVPAQRLASTGRFLHPK